MFFIILPLVVMFLSTATLFIMEAPTTLVYSVVIGINFLMIFIMIKGYLIYLKTSKELRDKEFAEEMTMMVKKIHEHREKFSKEALVTELEHVNRLINEYNLVHQDIVVEPVNIQDFLQNSTEEPV